MFMRNIKKLVVCTLTLILCIQTFGLSAVKAQAIDIWLDSPTGGLYGDSEYSFTLNWAEDFNLGLDETVTITLPKEADFLVSEAADIVYVTNGITKNALNLRFSESETEKIMTFMVESPVQGSKCSVTFNLKTPLDSTEMIFTAKVGNDKVPINPITNYLSVSFVIIPNGN